MTLFMMLCATLASCAFSNMFELKGALVWIGKAPLAPKRAASEVILSVLSVVLL